MKKTDLEYRNLTVDKVDEEEQGFSITTNDGWSFYLPNKKVIPHIGSVARFYGRGIGYTVRGVDIDGQEVFYKSLAEQKAEDAKEHAEFEEKERLSEIARAKRLESPLWKNPVPWPKTEAELLDYIHAMIADIQPRTDGDGYKAAATGAIHILTATFQWLSHEFGLSGFQAGYIALSCYGSFMDVKGPYAIIKAEDMLYPQSDPGVNLEWRAKWASWLKEEATKRLAETDYAAPQVKAHWEKLVK